MTRVRTPQDHRGGFSEYCPFGGRVSHYPGDPKKAEATPGNRGKPQSGFKQVQPEENQGACKWVSPPETGSMSPATWQRRQAGRARVGTASGKPPKAHGYPRKIRGNSVSKKKKKKKRKKKIELLAVGTDGPSKFDTPRTLTSPALVPHNPPDKVIQ